MPLYFLLPWYDLGGASFYVAQMSEQRMKMERRWQQKWLKKNSTRTDRYFEEFEQVLVGLITTKVMMEKEFEWLVMEFEWLVKLSLQVFSSLTEHWSPSRSVAK